MKKYPHGLTLQAVCAAVDDYQRHEESVPEEGILAAFNTLLGHSDIAEELRSLERAADTYMAAAQALRDDMYHWKQRAEAAEAKMAELEKQEPVGHFMLARDEDDSWWYEASEQNDKAIPLFTRSAPAADLVELVPDKLTADGVISMHDCGVVEGWNDCCDAIQRKIEEAK